MTKEEWMKVLDGAIDRAREDWYDATHDRQKEREAHMSMTMLMYVRDSLYEIIAN